jgi:uncharacterized protein (DUF433 family)
MIAIGEQLGVGIYTPAEAAFYARISTQKMKRWVLGTTGGEPVIAAQVGNDTITFLDFVQTLAIREIRQRHALPLQRIREGIDEAREKYKLPYPLARRHAIFLFSDQRRSGHGHIVIRLEGDEDGLDDRYVQLSGKHKGNYLMKQVVEMFLDDLTFDATSHLASQYRPMRSTSTAVLMDPHRRFGEPIVEASGYSVEALWHATNAEGSLEAAASEYGVSVEEVELANKYYASLLTDDAA